MNTRTIGTATATSLDRFVFAIGCIAIWDYALQHWPREANVVVAVSLVTFAVWYSWSFLGKPLLEGLSGRSQ